MKLKEILILPALTLLAISGIMQAIEITQNQQQIAALQQDIIILQEQAAERVTADEIEPILSDIAAWQEDVDYRLMAVEEDQQFYKAVWREYFRMEVD